MGTNKQWKRVPFTIELAKKIQSGEVEGRIKYNGKNFAEEIIILSYNYDKYRRYYPIRFAYVHTDEIDYLHDTSSLFIELPEETPKKINIEQLNKLKEYTQQLMDINQGVIDDLDSMLNELKTICNKGITTKHEFKPFDKVLVRDEKCNKWYPTIIGYVSPINGRYCDICRNLILSNTLPYEGNEHLVGKTDNPE